MNAFCLLLLAIATSVASGQSLPTHDEIFGALYGNHYNPATKLATWHCPQERDLASDNCNFEGDSKSEIDLLQAVLLDTGNTPRTYVVTSAAGGSGGCHACAPLMGFGIFRLQDGRWQLESKNVAIRFGRSGEPGEVELVKIGSDRYGFMLTNYDGNGGYFGTTALLLTPNGTAIQEAWSGMLDEDNEGAYDPTGKDGPAQRTHVDAAYRFLYDGDGDHYKFQVISHGFGYGSGSKYHSRTSVVSYHYTSGKYKQIHPSGKRLAQKIRR